MTFDLHVRAWQGRNSLITDLCRTALIEACVETGEHIKGEPVWWYDDTRFLKSLARNGYAAVPLVKPEDAA